MLEERNGQTEEQPLIYALDIGTRSIIGMLGRVNAGKVEILEVEKQEHPKRSMMDGQIEDIAQVAQGVAAVSRRLEERLGCKLTEACVAAAGRALRTEKGHGVLDLPAPEVIRQAQIGQLEAAAVFDAEQALHQGETENSRLFLVGYTATKRLLDGYAMTSLLGHTGQHLEADVVATFLPSEVIDSLYAVMRQAGLEVSSLTLEPIAALNAAIPEDLRLLNLALVDIGAGTSDIAICRDGSVVGYTMATVAGDEVTEALMREYLVDYHTAEQMKEELGRSEQISFTDILGMEQTETAQNILNAVEPAAQILVEEIAQQVLKLNGNAPSALFLAGGGSKLVGLREKLAQRLGMDAKRVALAGAHFKAGAYSQCVKLEDPEFTTPLGIAISAGLGLIPDSYRVFLNGKPAKLFRSGQVTVMELLMMNGYGYRDLLGRSGKSVMLKVDGRRVVFGGEPALPAQLKVNGAVVQPTVRIHAGDHIEFVPAKAGKDRQVQVRDVMEKLGVEILYRKGVPLEAEEEVAAGEEFETGIQMELEKKRTLHAEIPEGQRPDQTEVAPGRPCRIQFNGAPVELPGKADGNPYYMMDLLERSGIDFKHLERPVILHVNGKSCPFQQILSDGDEVEIRYEAE
ncbi:MAG: pilus assembly protein PilM [Lawsonibacter sp.]|jgi:cell division protein FtsA